MQDIPLEQITKRFQSLPESLQDAIFSEKGTDAVLKSCALRDIPADKTPLVGQLTNRVLLGYLQPESFAFEIQKETGIDALKATQVAHDIDTEIFSGVRLELKKLYPPTIQTPTVQAQGFVRSQPVAAEPPKPAPRYVVPIPERFKKTTPWAPQQAQDVPPQPTTNNSKLITQNAQPETQTKGTAQPVPTIADATEQRPAAPATSLTPQPPIQKAPQPTSPPMDPVVPLPTFIQSKFTNNISPETRSMKPDAQDSSSKIQDSSKNDALKSAFGKFTVSSTAPETTKEPMNPYRETIEEPKKPTEQKPAAKTQGKVIDLSQF